MSLQSNYGTGRRKTSCARVFLRPGTGKIVVNDRAFDGYFPNKMVKMIIRQPLVLTETLDKFDILVNVNGGGPTGQAGAIRHGISRALLEYNGELRPQLKAVVNEFVKGHKKGTLLGNIILERYLRDTKYVKNPLSQKELDKFEALLALFEKYAGQYDFDYLMVSAQAYQESGLDHSKRSPAGAIGVMQLLPSTAADPNVGIPDIEKLEKNMQSSAFAAAIWV